jgi:ribosomal protein S18 acetylase RimI-like enzyme
VTGRFIIDRLSAAHDRTSFTSGVEALDSYLRQFAGQAARKHFANCFVAVERSSGVVAGFYTLSADSISVEQLPEDILKRLPRYPNVPAALIGRLAVDIRFRRQRLGEALLRDAVDRALHSDPAVFALVVDAKDEAAANFYIHFGFRWLSRSQMRLFAPAASFEAD